MFTQMYDARSGLPLDDNQLYHLLNTNRWHANLTSHGTMPPTKKLKQQRLGGVQWMHLGRNYRGNTTFPQKPHGEDPVSFKTQDASLPRGCECLELA